MIELYRYIERYKFEDLIEKQKLYFRRIDMYEDRNEGRKTNPSRRRLPDYAAEHQENKKIVEMFEKADEAGLKHIFCCSWYKGEKESEEMWKEYGKKDGVAIVTDEDCLHFAIKGRFVEKHNMDYSMDYQKDYNHNDNPSKRARQKDKVFSKENEFRLEVFEHKNVQTINYDHVYVDVDLSLLIKRIIISPFASKEFVDDIRKLVKNKVNGSLVGKVEESVLKLVGVNTETGI